MAVPWAGLKGDALSTNPGDESTAGASETSDEEHNESRESRVCGLSRRLVQNGGSEMNGPLYSVTKGEEGSLQLARPDDGLTVR